MLQLLRTVRNEMHFIFHCIWVSEFDVYVVPSPDIFHNIFQSDIIEIEKTVFPIDI